MDVLMDRWERIQPRPFLFSDSGFGFPLLTFAVSVSAHPSLCHGVCVSLPLPLPVDVVSAESCMGGEGREGKFEFQTHPILDRTCCSCLIWLFQSKFLRSFSLSLSLSACLPACLAHLDVRW